VSDDAIFGALVIAFAIIWVVVMFGPDLWHAIRDGLRAVLRWRPKTRTQRELTAWVEWAGAQRIALETKRATNREASALWLAEYLEVAHSGETVLGRRYFPGGSLYRDDGTAALALLDPEVRKRVESYQGTWDEPAVCYLRNGEVSVVQRAKRVEYLDGVRQARFETKELARWTR
jgi:hypothetical protein